MQKQHTDNSLSGHIILSYQEYSVQETESHLPPTAGNYTLGIDVWKYSWRKLLKG